MLRNLEDLFQKFSGNRSVALYDYASRMTFDELFRRTLSVATELKYLGVGVGDNVAFLADKTPAVFPYIFGCFLVGAAFCPLDKGLPPSRLGSMLMDLLPRVVVSTRNYEAMVHAIVAQNGITVEQYLFIDDIFADKAEAAVPPGLFPDEVAYIIFTSGSTGRPKGVQITQANFVAFLNAFGARYGKGSGYNYLSLGPLFFDMTVLDCFVPLLYGDSTYLYNQPFVPAMFAAVIERHGINCFSAVPSVLSRLIGPQNASRLAPKLASMKLILLGAEPFGGGLIKVLFDSIPGLRIINAYGPTEGSVCCYSCEFGAHDVFELQEFPVGFPFPGVHWRLKTPNGEWATFGTGTLHIGGKQVMQGYANRPLETVARIVLIDGARYYNTGDLVEVDVLGRTHFRGREDDEVKISGFRVHLLDVLKNLERYPELESPFVVKVTIRGEDCLAVAFKAGRGLEVDSLTRKLQSELPPYMVPRVWISCAQIPFLANGKINRTGMKEMIASTIAEIESSEKPGRSSIGGAHSPDRTTGRLLVLNVGEH